MLTQKKLKELLFYEKDTGFFVYKKNVCKMKKGDIAGHIDSNGYIKIGLDYERYFSHRLAWLYIYGKFPDKQIDHINGIRYDNRICNLRDVSALVNANNKEANRKNKAIVKGVYFDGTFFTAKFRKNNKIINLGKFFSFDKAMNARVCAELKYGYYGY